MSASHLPLLPLFFLISNFKLFIYPFLSQLLPLHFSLASSELTPTVVQNHFDLQFDSLRQLGSLRSSFTPAARLQNQNSDRPLL
ncbi:hypothetical protein CsSME_00001117 [Camellia sinensis var. sinensis]